MKICYNMFTVPLNWDIIFENIIYICATRFNWSDELTLWYKKTLRYLITRITQVYTQNIRSRKYSMKCELRCRGSLNNREGMRRCGFEVWEWIKINGSWNLFYNISITILTFCVCVCVYVCSYVPNVTKCIMCAVYVVLANNIFVKPRLPLYARLKYVDVSIFLNNKTAIGTLRECNLLRGHERKYFQFSLNAMVCDSSLNNTENYLQYMNTHSELIFFSFSSQTQY